MTDRYRIQIESRARKHLEHIDPVIRRRIAKAIDGLSAEPEPPGCKPLKGFDDIMRIRVGDYRIVYMVMRDEGVINIFDIDHRKDIYR